MFEMTDKDKEMLLKYELPSIAECCSVDWIQDIIARYTAMKINRKWARYQKRLKRERFINSFRKQL